MLHLLPSLAGKIIIPQAVAAELAAGKKAGVDLPDIAGQAWLTLRTPVSVAALPLVTDLGPGESQVLALALELPGSLVIMDDLLARRVAETLHIPLTGTLGVLLAAKRNGLIRDIASILDMLQDLRFRVSSATRAAVLKLAEEI
jgi:predicted nucleic acid-binding protein